MAANRRGLQPFEQPPSPRLVQSVAYISLHETRGRPKLSAYRTIPSGSPSSDASRELTIQASALLRQILATRSLHRSSHSPTRVLTGQAEPVIGEAGKATRGGHCPPQRQSAGLGVT